MNDTSFLTKYSSTSLQIRIEFIIKKNDQVFSQDYFLKHINSIKELFTILDDEEKSSLNSIWEKLLNVENKLYNLKVNTTSYFDSLIQINEIIKRQ